MKQKGDFSERRVAGFLSDALVPLLTRNIYLRSRLNPVKLWVVWKLSHSFFGNVFPVEVNKTGIYHKLRHSDLLNVVVSAVVFVFSESHVHGNRSISFHGKQNHSDVFVQSFHRQKLDSTFQAKRKRKRRRYYYQITCKVISGPLLNCFSNFLDVFSSTMYKESLTKLS